MLDRRIVPILGLLALGLLAGGCAALGGGPAARRPGLISVPGVGRAAVRPDVALAHLGAEARAPQLADATAEVARRLAAVLERVKALGVAERDITTVAYSVEPLLAPRRSEEEPWRVVGYRATNVVQLRIRAPERAGAVLDGAVAAGANVVRSLQFTVDDPSAARARARERAVKDAEERARQLAAAAGATLGRLVRLREEGAGPRPVFDAPMARTAVGLTAGGPGPIEAGELEVVVSVEAQYRLAR